MLFPIMWPGPDTTVPLRKNYWTEIPDPLASCAGYKLPTGLPVLLQMGDGGKAPQVTAYSLRVAGDSGADLESCVFTEATYTNPDPAMQALGRDLLAPRDAVVLIPRAVLDPGESYTVSLTVDGQVYSWTFSIAPLP